MRVDCDRSRTCSFRGVGFGDIASFCPFMKYRERKSVISGDRGVAGAKDCHGAATSVTEALVLL